MKDLVRVGFVAVIGSVMGILLMPRISGLRGATVSAVEARAVWGGNCYEYTNNMSDEAICSADCGFEDEYIGEGEDSLTNLEECNSSLGCYSRQIYTGQCGG